MLKCHIFESQVRYNRKGYQQRVVTANIFYIISRLMEIQYIYMREKIQNFMKEMSRVPYRYHGVMKILMDQINSQ